MNSRFLFRGKRKENNEDGKAWLCGCLQVLEDVSCGATSYYIHHPRGGRMNHMHLVAPATIGQCTGLPAAKSYRGESDQDKLVFEGDVIYESDWQLAFVVFWNDEAAGWFVKSRDGEMEILSDVVSECEIIGNIHDNPDLLEVSGE